jgi:hypothetical protein
MELWFDDPDHHIRGLAYQLFLVERGLDPALPATEET